MVCAMCGGWPLIAKPARCGPATWGKTCGRRSIWIARGGNYGWRLREGRHPFADQGRQKNLIEPIWEYDHTVGKSITGGMVYRGRRIPELVGGYLYADYVTGKMWALFYDAERWQVTANREIPLPSKIAVTSFGEDEQGEAYFMTSAITGECIYGLYPADK